MPLGTELLEDALLLSGARVSEFVAIRVDDFYLEEAMLHVRKGKGRKERYVPILPELAQELRTHLGDRKAGHLFVTRAARAASSNS
ncbi:MAG TPA: tyrosine-type recombinase/integrase [Anaeromyxobacteraceae bacterium]|nr:tyrosine-type recombinase/integrase [Anaeromyxobacteraceae bacterium]